MYGSVHPHRRPTMVEATPEDFQRYFPTSTLATGYDIIFFGVSYMVFNHWNSLDRQPFQNVLSGLIRDEQGRKMSKSLGPTVSTQWISEIVPKCL